MIENNFIVDKFILDFFYVIYRKFLRIQCVLSLKKERKKKIKLQIKLFNQT